jgi:putative pyruvate formate lyase activating enzyme
VAYNDKLEGLVYMICRICPRKCGVERDGKSGFCGTGVAISAAKAYLHKWEEPCISGVNGSGTVFFSGCNLKCVYCQNCDISQENYGKELTIEQLAKVFLSLQDKGAHNINLVTPTHFVLQIREALIMAKAAGLEIPIVYNSSGYDSQECLKIMNGLVDIYLPDIKYFSPEVSQRYSKAADYFDVASYAVKEMYRQVGSPVYDKSGIIQRGLMIRHLILPGLTAESVKILEWVRENLPNGVSISLMSQYIPYHKASDYPEINRRITRWEYERVKDKLFKLGFVNGYIQERDSAIEEYIPLFDLDGLQ